MNSENKYSDCSRAFGAFYNLLAFESQIQKKATQGRWYPFGTFALTLQALLLVTTIIPRLLVLF